MNVYPVLALMVLLAKLRECVEDEEIEIDLSSPVMTRQRNDSRLTASTLIRAIYVIEFNRSG